MVGKRHVQKTFVASSARVMVVEDDKVTATIADAMLRSLGCDVVLACDGHVALELYQKKAVDLVLLDLQMPLMAGYEVAYEIRQIEIRERLREVPIVAVTGLMGRQVRARCLRAGMNDCLPKPYTMEMLEMLLCRYAEGLFPLREEGGGRGLLRQTHCVM